MDSSELHHCGLAELSRLISAREISPLELTDYFLARIDRLDARFHSYKVVLHESARREAKGARDAAPRSPLHGIPFAVKDVFDVAGLATTMGSRLLADRIAVRDAAAVRSLRDAGMIVLGKTHMVQFAYGGVGINNEDGTPLNPWAAEPHVPGGSSSGSAVAVAAGLAPCALGSDTGGSVRIPAALCGITGLKTTEGSLDMSGVAPLSWTLDSIGPMCHSAEDAALLYATMSGDDVVPALEPDLRGVRLAFAETVFWDEVDPEVAEAVSASGEVFRELGAVVASISFEQAVETLRLNPNGLVTKAEAYAVNREFIENHFERIDPIIANRMLSARDILAIDYIKAKRDWVGLRGRVLEGLRGLDALLVPTTPIPAMPLSKVMESLDSYDRINRLYLRNTAIGNVLGFCGISVPCGFTLSGLPIGLMIYGKPNQEWTILRIAGAFQRITDFHLRRP